MKTFFDRISDLLTIRKDLGRRLRGKSMGSVSCSSEGDLDKEFYYPFQETAKYLGMNYTGHIHTWVENNEVPEEVAVRIQEYFEKLES
jgi:hypothetical protein